MYLSEAFEVYINVYVLPYQSQATCKQFECAKKSITANNDPLLEELTINNVIKWQQHNISKGVSPNTIRGYTEKLRKVLRYHLANGVKCLSPELVHSPQKAETIPQWLTAKEVREFIAEAYKKRNGRARISRYRNAAIISLLYSSGLRVHELCKLNRTDIIDGRITIIGKGRKPRLVFVDHRSKYYIDLYLNTRKDNHPALFISSYGNRISSDKIRESFRLNSKYFGKEVHPHTLRHSYATNLLTNGCHIFTLKQLMGHSSIQSTQKYLHIVDKDLEADYKKYHTTK